MRLLSPQEMVLYDSPFSTFIIFILPSLVPIIIKSFCQADATIEQIKTLFYILRYKNRV